MHPPLPPEVRSVGGSLPPRVEVTDSPSRPAVALLAGRELAPEAVEVHPPPLLVEAASKLAEAEVREEAGAAVGALHHVVVVASVEVEVEREEANSEEEVASTAEVEEAAGVEVAVEVEVEEVVVEATGEEMCSPPTDPDGARATSGREPEDVRETAWQTSAVAWVR